MWEYRAKLVAVVDGDTIDLRVDVGFHMEAVLRFRLLDVDTYELRDKDPAIRLKAIEGKNYLNKLNETSGEWPIRILTRKADAFGRWLATVYYTDRDGTEHCLNTDLLACGLAMPWARKPKPLTP